MPEYLGDIGSIIIKECTFTNVNYPIDISYYNYVAIHENTFINYLKAVKVSESKEVNISSNLFYEKASNI